MDTSLQLRDIVWYSQLTKLCGSFWPCAQPRFGTQTKILKKVEISVKMCQRHNADVTQSCADAASRSFSGSLSLFRLQQLEHIPNSYRDPSNPLGQQFGGPIEWLIEWIIDIHWDHSLIEWLRQNREHNPHRFSRCLVITIGSAPQEPMLHSSSEIRKEWMYNYNRNHIGWQRLRRLAFIWWQFLDMTAWSPSRKALELSQTSSVARFRALRCWTCLKSGTGCSNQDF